MDAKLKIVKRPGRHVSGMPDRSLERAFDLLGLALQPITSEAAQDISDLKPAGRDLAKDVFEGGDVPLSMSCFDGEEARFGAVKNKNYREGKVLVVRYEGPRVGSGMRELLSAFATPYRARQVGRLRVSSSWMAEEVRHADL